MKTVEQAAKDIANSGGSYLCDRDINGWMQLSFKKGVAFAQQWISVEEELPEAGSLILVKLDNEDGQVSTARYIGSGSFSVDFEEMAAGKITHWRCIELT